MADFRTQLEVNLFGPVAMIQAFLPLIRRGGGRIVNVGSIGGMLVLPLNGAYSASKFGMRAISDALRLELRQWNIHVSLIEVAPVKTAIFGKTFAELDGLENDARRGRLTRSTSSRSPPSGRPWRRRRPTPIRRSSSRRPIARRADVRQAQDQVSGRPRREGRPRSRRRSPTGRATERLRASSGFPSRSSARGRLESKGDSMSAETKPKVLIVYFSLTQQSGESPRRWRRRSRPEAATSRRR